jgi:hypothetical protein
MARVVHLGFQVVTAREETSGKFFQPRCRDAGIREHQFLLARLDLQSLGLGHLACHPCPGPPGQLALALARADQRREGIRHPFDGSAIIVAGRLLLVIEEGVGCQR